MIAKDPGKMHYYISLVKSGVRIAGCIGAVVLQSITLLAVSFLLAEILGILEEVIDQMEYKKWECIVCGWIYDEEKGYPEDGIEPGTRWEDIPEDWYCPECGVGKDDFDMVEII